MINVLIWCEYVSDRDNPDAVKVYPEGIHKQLYDFLSKVNEYNVITATLHEPDFGLSDQRLEWADVIIWWGHGAHDKVPDEVADRVVDAIHRGCGFIPLHSSHNSKPFKKLMGTVCNLRWRADDRERIYTIAPHHPIAFNVPDFFEIPNEEMYGERFDIPAPAEIIFLGWFAGGELFRSGITYDRGFGKIFYFQPGHETCPTFMIPEVQQIIINAVSWASKKEQRSRLDSSLPNFPPEDDYKEC